MKCSNHTSIMCKTRCRIQFTHNAHAPKKSELKIEQTNKRMDQQWPCVTRSSLMRAAFNRFNHMQKTWTWDFIEIWSKSLRLHPKTTKNLHITLFMHRKLHSGGVTWFCHFFPLIFFLTRNGKEIVQTKW